MSKTKKPAPTRGAIPKLPTQSPPATAPVQTHAVRETVESIVIAFVLAFLFRTFEAEAFVIPTGSMAPTLMGRHKDVDCPKCGYRYQVSASEEESEDPARQPSDCIAGMCPICRYVLPMRPDVPGGVPEKRLPEIDFQRSYNGDRILVNKYVYTFSDPERWDVVVFKYPGDAKINYIKRLVGLPGETLRIFQGDLFVGGRDASRDDEFKIERKPPDKVLAMRQLVHDTDYDSAELTNAGWPLRWNPPTGSSADGWKVEKENDGINVRQRYILDRNGDDESWLRYEHTVPDYATWQELIDAKARSGGSAAPFSGMKREDWPRQLITDSNPYNGRVDRIHQPYADSLQVDPLKQGVHWVGDLMVEADVEVKAAAGELLLDLVEAGQHFTCTIDLKTGEATLGVKGIADYAPKAKTPLRLPGDYHVEFANVDDQLLLWVDGDLISFDGGTAYDAERVFGDRRRLRPQTSQDDPGDLAPAGIGGRDGAKLVVDSLRIWRDVYYIADSSKNRQRFGSLITDFDPQAAAQRLLTVLPAEVVDAINTGQPRSEASLAKLPPGIAKAVRNSRGLLEVFLSALPQAPTLWDSFLDRRSQDFRLGDEQLFVMGDNSAESSDARLWYSDSGRGGQPGGDYLEKRLLIGKALCVYWPHSWHRIPGTPIPFPLFPNFADMRLVR